jgi:hypothetical protein
MMHRDWFGRFIEFLFGTPRRERVVVARSVHNRLR